MGHFVAVKLSPRRTTKRPCFVCFVSTENYEKKQESIICPSRANSHPHQKAVRDAFYQRNTEKSPLSMQANKGLSSERSSKHVCIPENDTNG